MWILLGILEVHSDEVPFRTLPDGIAVEIGGNDVELRVASPHAFRLHIYPQSVAGPSSSIYLSGAGLPSTPFTTIHEGAAVGIKTTFGEILANPENATWTLRDDTGATLTDWATLGKALPPVPGKPAVPAQAATPTSPAVSGRPATPGTPASFQLMAGIPSAASFQLVIPPAAAKYLFYGSGNTPARGALTQAGVTPRTGNGSTGLPQYWSSTGYGALVIGQTDNEPASWRKRTRGSIEWTVPGPGADVYLMPARTLYDWLRDDAELTGFAPVPPLWAFGYLQSRWGWESKGYIDDTFAHFRQDQLPVDAFIFDFEWYTTTPDYSVKAPGDPKFVDFGWNPKLLPDPAAQIADFAKQGLHIVGIRKPRLGNSDNLAMARSKGWILPFNPLDPNGGDIRSRNLDFSNPDVRAYWEENNRKFLAAGMAGFWNDEGETTYTEYSYWNLAELDLFRQVDPAARFWSLNRSFAPGVQRFGAAVWTGDIGADWKTFARTPGELLSYGLSNMPYSTCDIGGFYGKETPELLTRWMEAGVFFPVMRSHSERGIPPHFPWLSGPDAEAAIRKALDLRYQLIPYYYSLAHEAYRTGAPLMRPLVMEFPDDAKVLDLTDEWLMGRGLLAAPILDQGGNRTVYLPNDQWYNFGTTQTTQGPATINVTAAKLDEIPVYVRAGTLLPLGPVVQYTGQATSAPLELQIYPGHDATFNFVEDDGKTLAYQSGNVRTVSFSWNDAAKTLTWKTSGGYHGPNLFRAMKTVLFSPHGKVEKPASLDQGGSLTFNPS
ncbi:MAG TPA: TIM-barrel domain-containing protein [Candidatus Methylacidiphilales bacterium]|jgi:alpha-glucosidase|nr:TIM-barrel domain-containing protein [Candidatus Methylacidiphilales bacterium]